MNIIPQRKLNNSTLAICAILIIERTVTVTVTARELSNIADLSSTSLYIPAILYAGFSASEVVLLFCGYCCIHKERVCDF
jgi:hypothetical protein